MSSRVMPVTRRSHRKVSKHLHLFWSVLFLGSLLFGSEAGSAAEKARQALTIGYLELADDPRYEERSAYARIQLRSRLRPLAGARVALDEAKTTGQIIGVDFALKHFRGESLAALVDRVERWQQQGIGFVLLDLPAEVTARLAAATRDRSLLLFNVSAPEDILRDGHCEAHLMHTLPSRAMTADALVQYLVSKNWRRLLVLQGPLPADGELADALQRSARRFGAKVVTTRAFEPGNDPRRREANNIPLLTAGENYDVLVVLDSEGEFGRYVPYQSKIPRPVVGTTGLTARAWTWVWERHGAPQVNERFQDRADRRMGDADWAAWAAVKAIVQSAIRSRSTDFPPVSAYLKGEKLRLDGAKGPALSFRSWNNQLRQPVLLTTHNAVIARAPLDGFLHPEDELDTLGSDEGESRCEFAEGEA
ncbi:ABC transporter substrate-binding protein [Gilvimarinus sp. F26214L]|uniref:ABC transporter substrate-binding protein n=1 Tax=Gilvimarinus sp. DZF01 TaxID=3461371 RepID=UPI0040452EF9